MGLNGLTVGGGNPGAGMVAMKKNVPGKSDADIRDSISLLVGGGYTGLNDEQSQLQYQRLADLVGTKKAQNLVSHIIIQNHRPDFKAMKPLERVARFYDVNSSNQDTNDILQKTKALGTGVLSGYTDSASLVNQQQQGNVVTAPILNAITKK